MAYDEKGIVYHHPSEVKVDVVISNGEHWLIECKSRVRRSDVAELMRIAEVYEEKEGVKPSRLYMISPFVDDDAQKLAALKGVLILTYE